MGSRPFLLQMAGISGTGKSTLARLIGQRTGAVVIDLDVVKSAALDAGAPWDLAGRIAYGASWALADSLLEQGGSVVLDSPCRFQQIVDEGSAIARRRAAVFAYIECVVADETELRRRVRHRARLRSQMHDLGVPPPDAPRDAYRAQIEAFGPAVLETKVPTSPWLRIDTSGPPDRCLARALEYLDRLGAACGAQRVSGDAR